MTVGQLSAGCAVAILPDDPGPSRSNGLQKWAARRKGSTARVNNPPRSNRWMGKKQRSGDRREHPNHRLDELAAAAAAATLQEEHNGTSWCLVVIADGTWKCLCANSLGSVAVAGSGAETGEMEMGQEAQHGG